MTPANARLARLRGGIPAVEVGARGIESVARNAGCTRLRAIVIAGLTPTEIVKHVLRAEPDIMSPFAMTLSQAYERRLLENGGTSLLTAYRDKGHLGPTEVKISSVADHAPGDTVLARQRRELETQRLLDMKHSGNPLAPNLILNPRLPLALVGVTHAIELDYMVASDDAPSYRVGVIKSYADRGGKTDKAHIRSACREASVGTLALRQHLESRNNDPDRAGDRIDMVLRAPGSFVPRLFASMRAESEMASLVRALSAAPADLDEVERLVPAGANFASRDVIDQIPNNYRSNCKEHCALWEHCRAQALAAGQPIILGDAAAEQLAAAGSITRALDLLDGRGRPPENHAEAALGAELRAAALLLDRIANG
ncbi:hypothetical protein JQ614_17215 [Bradyrhizobium diazoefficiens]|uniref:hypothetical protein n=1 Tax=Bradyrhizobium diazoefficiens TaxID=1355477 RepID=UPI001B8B8A77|nr:hypothetical protein [Bradyrhizobium diazoefficiens]MBR0863480.1 hypothetical protein [Bradyrhizobium diazoefficiens]MBR0888165.1 hypothetical protein [Bradyrhizobium diazoefficiens]MBR0919806.1 hypothetical protein [Bradyrhizobium diazoefficiens]